MPGSLIQLETSSELLVQRWNNGVKLVKPNEMTYDPRYSVANLLQLPFCVYFLNTESALCDMSDQVLIAFDYPSKSYATGKTMFDVAPNDVASRIVSGHKDVMNTQQLSIVEEDVICEKDIHFQSLSVIIPWYSDENKIIGVLGCSIVLGQHSLSGSLSELNKLGFLNRENNNVIPGEALNDLYFSKREVDVMKLIVRGQTAKAISKTLCLSTRTVEKYLENIKIKTACYSKSQLIDKFFDKFS